MSRIKRLRIRIHSHVSEIFKKSISRRVRHSNAIVCERLRIFRKIYLFVFHKIPIALIVVSRPFGLPVTLQWPRFTRRQSISWARNFCNLRVWLSIMEFEAVHKRCAWADCNLRPAQVESGHIFLFFIINVMYYYTVFDFRWNGDDTRFQWIK